MGVEFCTDIEAGTRAETKALMCERWSSLLEDVSEPHTYYRAALVKIADRHANIVACVEMGNTKKLKMYRGEHRDFMAAMNRLKHEKLWARTAFLFDTLEKQGAD